MANIPIRKLREDGQSYYPLSVGESVVTTHPITVQQDIGTYKAGDIIPALTTIDSIITNIAYGGAGGGGGSVVIDDITIKKDAQNRIYVKKTALIDEETLKLNNEGYICVNGDKFDFIDEEQTITKKKTFSDGIKFTNSETPIDFESARIEKYGDGISIIGIKNVDDETSAVSKSYVSASIGNKVDKVEGKGLSTNDFTTEEKEKLQDLENYDDTELRESVGDIYSYFTTDKDLASIEMDGTWAIYNQNDVQTSTSTSKSLNLENGYKVTWDGRWKWVNNDSQKPATRCDGNFGTDLPERNTYQSISVTDKKTTNSTYTQSIYANKNGLILSGTTISNAKVVKATGEYKNSASISVAFKGRFYIGYSLTNDITGDIIKSLNKRTDLTTTKVLTESNVTTSNNQYLVYAYPQSYGELTNIKENGAFPILGAFTKKTSIIVKNDAGLDVVYIAYVSNNVGAFHNSTLEFS